MIDELAVLGQLDGRHLGHVRLEDDGQDLVDGGAALRLHVGHQGAPLFPDGLEGVFWGEVV